MAASLYDLTLLIDVTGLFDVSSTAESRIYTSVIIFAVQSVPGDKCYLVLSGDDMWCMVGYIKYCQLALTTLPTGGQMPNYHKW